MVVNTLKISFCADHSWREKGGRVKVVEREGGWGESGGEGERRWGGVVWVRKGKSALLIKERKKGGDVFFPWKPPLSLGTSRQRQYKKRYAQQTRAKQREREKKKKK